MAASIPRRRRSWAARVALLAPLLAILLAPVRASARDALCAADLATETAGSVDAMLTAAQALVAPLDRPRARALYLAVLARDPRDEEAAVGLAQVDAWDGCLALAERGYRDVLARSPGNVDARAGLADVLAWTGRWRDAEAVLDGGLEHAPLAPGLLSRRARVALSRGDVRAALRDLAEAERVSPLDPELRDVRDRVFVGQARIGQRVELFPSGADDVYTTDASAMTRWGRLRLELGATVVSRYGASRETRSGPMKTRILDGRQSVGVFQHFRGGAWLGGSFAISAPALALPRYALGASGSTSVGRTFSFGGSVAYWKYEGDRDVVVASPALGAALSDTVDVTLRYWLTSVVLGGVGSAESVEAVHSVGARVGWRPATRLSLGLDYTYGVQLERNPSGIDLLGLRSHVVSVLGRRLLGRAVGVDLAISVERRENLASGAVVLAPAVEAGAFVRW